MKIIEALKMTKDLQRKAEDIRDKLAKYCSDLDDETPAYKTVEEQRRQISEWLQSHSDILKEILNLRLRIQRTNLSVEVPIEVSKENIVTKPIAHWIHRRKDLSQLEANAWSILTDRGLRPKAFRVEGEDAARIANIRKYYDQKTRDQKVEDFTSEKSRIDAALEIANATNDLLDL